MNDIPMSFEEWKHCIEIKCGIPLTKEFCQQRIQDLVENHSRSSVNFRKLYGEEHTKSVIAWFTTALEELS